ncbi:MAG: hypothetical protein HYS12_01715 [Planctomycetes bacterium]|nr:hypothetical protein [Planctomycetota bacterium]
MSSFPLASSAAKRRRAQKPYGTSETLTPADFEQKYGFKNDPAKVRLLGN